MKKLFLYLLILTSVNILAQNSLGNLTGKVIDKTTLEPLPGVNIILLGSEYGSASDIDGKFRITNISVGSY